jgi:hypothetical protein
MLAAVVESWLRGAQPAVLAAVEWGRVTDRIPTPRSRPISFDELGGHPDGMSMRVTASPTVEGPPLQIGLEVGLESCPHSGSDW